MSLMTAAILKKFESDLELTQVEVPVPKDGEVLVRVTASGLCGSDLHIQDGKIKSVPLPHIPGHELAGIVEEVGGGVTGFKKGDHVVSAIDVTCGVCRFCRTGRGNLCRGLKRIGFELQGSHAEFAVVPEGNLFLIDKNLPPEKAAVIPDAVSCMYHSIKTQGNVRAGDRILILGIGGLGIQGVQIGKYFGAEVFCTSRQDAKLEIAKKFGADHGINTKRQDLKEEIIRLTNGEMCDVVFDNIGIESSVQQSLEVVRPGGKVVVVGYIDQTFTADIQDVMINEKEIIGIRASNRQDLFEAIRLVEKGVIDPYVYSVMPLTEINAALARLRAGESLGRTVLIP